MSPVREALPPEILYRLGRLPNPLAWPPPKSTGAGRFDDALGRFSTLYAAEQRVACFVESLARFRLSPQALLQLRRMGGSEEPLIVPSIPGDWRAKRILSRFRLRAGQKWLDLRSQETREVLRGELADKLLTMGIPDIDAGEVRSLNRQFTQAISRWAHERGYNGIAYRSRFDDSLDCWAIFSGAGIEPIGPIELISPEDRDLREVARLFGLRIQ